MTDPIADMLTRIRNAMVIRKPDVVLPYSTLKHGIADILQRTGYVKSVDKIEKSANAKPFAELRITLKYNGKESVITNLKRISKPGRRVYVSKDDLPTVLNNLGIAIISTPQGLMTNKEARNKNVGGEILCEIY